MPPQQRGGDDVVAVGEDVRLDRDRFARRALDREATAVDLRRDRLDRRCGAAARDRATDSTPAGRLSRTLCEGRRRRLAIESGSLSQPPITRTPCGPQSAPRRASSRRLPSVSTAIDRPSSVVAIAGAKPRAAPATDPPCRAAFPIARSATSSAARTGSVQSSALSRTSSVSPTMRSPRSFTSWIASPFRRTPSARTSGEFHDLVGHLRARGIEPRDVLHFGAADAPPLKELAPPQHRVRFPQPNHHLDEVEELGLLAASDPSRAS